MDTLGFFSGLSMGVGVGVLIGVVSVYLSSVRPLINDIRRLRYDGFSPERPMPPRPKTVPTLEIRED